jgi:hypothetical protein
VIHFKPYRYKTTKQPQYTSQLKRSMLPQKQFFCPIGHQKAIFALDFVNILMQS